MKWYAVSFFILLGAVAAAGAEESPVRQDALVYYMPVSYHNAQFKKQALVEGVYFYYGKGFNYSVEAEIDQTKIDYNTDFNYRQQDYTMAYSKYAPGTRARAGIHIAKTTTVNDNSLTFFLGTTKYNPGGRDFGLDMYVSNYDKYVPKVMAFQFTPAIGRTIGKSSGASIYLQTKGYFIHTTKQIGNESKDFLSAEQNVTYSKRNYSVSVSGWTGKQVFAVRSDGFVVYNTSETHRGGYGVSVSYSMPGNTKLSLFARKEMFSDFGIDNSASATQVGFSAGHTF